MSGEPTKIGRPLNACALQPLTGDEAIAAGINWKLSDEARAAIREIEENVAQALAMAPFMRVGGAS